MVVVKYYPIIDLGGRSYPLSHSEPVGQRKRGLHRATVHQTFAIQVPVHNSRHGEESERVQRSEYCTRRSFLDKGVSHIARPEKQLYKLNIVEFNGPSHGILYYVCRHVEFTLVCCSRVLIFPATQDDTDKYSRPHDHRRG